MADQSLKTRAPGNGLALLAAQRLERQPGLPQIGLRRLGRSPDKGDAVVMCWSRGDATMLGQYIPRDQRIGGMGGRMPKTVTSKDRGRRRMRR